MRILFISNWASNNGLSRSTVHPHLNQLATYDAVEKIVYISIESLYCEKHTEETGKVEHVPILKHKDSTGITARLINQIRIQKLALIEAERLRPDLIICRGAQAGALGYVIWKKHSVPYYVESFEPHAEYMVDCGVWSRFGIKYLIQRTWETKIKRTAAGLITVSERYAEYLLEKENISVDRLRTVPCWVDKEIFRFSEENRELIRADLGVGDSFVCIYLGQFGGLYYDSEAFKALKTLRDAAECPLHFLILTPSEREKIVDSMTGLGFQASEYTLRYVNYDEIPAYLSAADIGISFVRSTAIAAYCSPIKYGEYWACGLPIIASKGVGDESIWIDSERLGCTVDFLSESSIKQAAEKILELVDCGHHRESIRIKGTSIRSKEKLIEVYAEIIEGIGL